MTEKRRWVFYEMVEAYRIDGGDAAGFGGGGSDMAGVSDVQRCSGGKTADRSGGRDTDLDAVVAVEDHRFWKHHGFDIIAIGRAVKNNVVAGSLQEGGSTITQQLAKNMYFSLDKTFTRKVAETFMAMKMEREYTKDEILEIYVNTIYFGDGYYGIRQASEGYYGKEPAQLSDDECIMLAGLPNAPSVYSPSVNPELAAERQQYVAEQMEKYGYTGDEEK